MGSSSTSTHMNMLKNILITVFFISLVFAKNSFNSAKVDFSLECESPLCKDYEVASFMAEVQSLYPEESVYLVQVWRNEVTLLICSSSSVTDALNTIQNSEETFAGVSVESIRFNAPCIMYTEETEQEIEVHEIPNPIVAGSAPFSFM